jgi:hypothetical protein
VGCLQQCYNSVAKVSVAKATNYPWTNRFVIVGVIMVHLVAEHMVCLVVDHIIYLVADHMVYCNILGC